MFDIKTGDYSTQGIPTIKTHCERRADDPLAPAGSSLTVRCLTIVHYFLGPARQVKSPSLICGPRRLEKMTAARNITLLKSRVSGGSVVPPGDSGILKVYTYVCGIE